MKLRIPPLPKHYITRQAALEALEAYRHKVNKGNISPQYLIGHPGAGKSTCAADYALRSYEKGKYDAVYWLNINNDWDAAYMQWAKDLEIVTELLIRFLLRLNTLYQECYANYEQAEQYLEQAAKITTSTTFHLRRY